MPTPLTGLMGVLWVKVKHIHIRGKILKRPLVRVALGQRARRYTFSPCALQGQTTVWNKAFTLPVDSSALHQTVRLCAGLSLYHSLYAVGRANKQLDQVAAADAGKRPPAAVQPCGPCHGGGRGGQRQHPSEGGHAIGLLSVVPRLPTQEVMQYKSLSGTWRVLASATADPTVSYYSQWRGQEEASTSSQQQGYEVGYVSLVVTWLPLAV